METNALVRKVSPAELYSKSMRYNIILVYFVCNILGANTAPEMFHKFLQARNNLLPAESLVEIVGSFEIKQPGAEGEPDYIGNSAKFRTIIDIGNPAKVFFESKDFRVPVSGHHGDVYSESHVVVVGDGQSWYQYNIAYRRVEGETLSDVDWVRPKRITITPVDLENLFLNRPLYIKAGIFDASCIFPENLEFFSDSTLLDFDPFANEILLGSKHSPDPENEMMYGSLNYELDADSLRIQFGNINYVADFSFKLPEMLPHKYSYTFIPDDHVLRSLEFSDYRSVLGQPLLIVPHRFVSTSFKNGRQGGELTCSISSVRLLSEDDRAEAFATPLPTGWKVNDKRIGERFIIENPSAELEGFLAE